MNDTNREALPYPDEGPRTHWVGCFRAPRHHNCAVVQADRLLSALEREREARKAVEGWLAVLVNTAAAPADIGGWYEEFVGAHGHAARYLHEREHGTDAPTAVERAMLTIEDSNKTTAAHTERNE